MASLEESLSWAGGEDTIDEEILRMPTDEIVSRTRLLENEIRVRGGNLAVLK